MKQQNKIIFLTALSLTIAGFGSLLIAYAEDQISIDSQIRVTTDDSYYVLGEPVIITVDSAFDPSLEIELEISNSNGVVFLENGTTNPRFVTFEFFPVDKGTYIVKAVTKNFSPVLEDKRDFTVVDNFSNNIVPPENPIPVGICSNAEMEKKYQSWMGTEINRGNANDGGKFQHYENASIFCHELTGPHEVHGGILAKYFSLSWDNGKLGYPTTDELKSGNTPYSNFQNGVICWIGGQGAVDKYGVKGPEACESNPSSAPVVWILSGTQCYPSTMDRALGTFPTPEFYMTEKECLSKIPKKIEFGEFYKKVEEVCEKTGGEWSLHFEAYQLDKCVCPPGIVEYYPYKNFYNGIGDPKFLGCATNNSIPEWVRSNAEWWAHGTIEDSDFVSGIQYLIKEKIIQIPETVQPPVKGSKEIPSWIKNNADWWSQGLISDEDFLKGIQYLVENRIILISTEIVGPQIIDFYVTFVGCNDFNQWEKSLFGSDGISEEYKIKIIDLLKKEKFRTYDVCVPVYDSDVSFNTDKGLRIAIYFDDDSFKYLHIGDFYRDNTDKDYRHRGELLSIVDEITLEVKKTGSPMTKFHVRPISCGEASPVFSEPLYSGDISIEHKTRILDLLTASENLSSFPYDFCTNNSDTGLSDETGIKLMMYFDDASYNLVFLKDTFRDDPLIYSDIKEILAAMDNAYDSMYP